MVSHRTLFYLHNRPNNVLDTILFIDLPDLKITKNGCVAILFLLLRLWAHCIPRLTPKRSLFRSVVSISVLTCTLDWQALGPRGCRDSGVHHSPPQAGSRSFIQEARPLGSPSRWSLSPKKLWEQTTCGLTPNLTRRLWAQGIKTVPSPAEG